MSAWSLIVDVIVVAGSLVAVLDYFGIKPRPVGGVTPSRKWKLAIMLGLVALSLGLTGYSFYRSFRPKIVEKIVEKPVDRVVEKLVPAECPAPKPTASGKSRKQASTSKSPPTASTSGDRSPAVGSVTQGPCSNLQIGGSDNQQSGNCTSPNRRVKAADVPALIESLSQHRGIVRLAVGGGDVEAFQFAQDWYEIFQKAQWDLNPKRIVQFMDMTGNLPTGVRITVKGERLSSKAEIKVEPNSPLSSVVNALNAEGITPTFWQEPSYEDGVILISIDAKPADKQTN
jgi:hypothetical protein